MRSKNVIGALVAGAALVFALVMASRLLQPAPSLPDRAVAGKAGPTQSRPPAAEPAQIVETPETRIAAAPPAAPEPPDSAREASVRQRIAALGDLAMMNDASSRDAILLELQNPDRQIRKGALEAIIQFGDRSVVPRLQEIAAQTDEPFEKQEILDAVEYINLPSLTEYLEGKKARQSAGLTNAPQTPGRRPASAFRAGDPAKPPTKP